MNYIVGRGSIYVAERSSGQPSGGFSFLGHSPEFKFNPGRNGTRFQTGGTAPPIVESGGVCLLQITLDEFDENNLHRIFHGYHTVISASSVSALALTAYVGKFIPVNHINISSLVVKNNAETVTYVNGTDYTEDLLAGGFIVIDGGGISDEDTVKVWYSYADQDKVSVHTVRKDDVWLRFNGINAITEKPLVVDFYKVAFKAIENFPLISPGFGDVLLKGVAKYDTEQSDTTEDGRIMRIRGSFVS